MTESIATQHVQGLVRIGFQQHPPAIPHRLQQHLLFELELPCTLFIELSPNRTTGRFTITDAAGNVTAFVWIGVSDLQEIVDEEGWTLSC
jgi:predicted alpha/beta-hydrolase family hydrolase